MKFYSILFFLLLIIIFWFQILDEAIQNLVLEAPWFKSCRRLCAYISCSALREVETSKLLSEILNNSSKGVFFICAQVLFSFLSSFFLKIFFFVKFVLVCYR